MSNEQIPQEVIDQINDTLFMTGGNSDSEKDFYMLGAKFGYSLAADQLRKKDEEIERMKGAIQELILVVENLIEAAGATYDATEYPANGTSDIEISAKVAGELLDKFKGKCITPAPLFSLPVKQEQDANYEKGFLSGYEKAKIEEGVKSYEKNLDDLASGQCH